MKVAPALLLATVLALNSAAPAALAAPVPHQPRVLLDSLHLFALNFDALRTGIGRPPVALTSNTLPLLGMGLLVLLAVRILRSRR